MGLFGYSRSYALGFECIHFKLDRDRARQYGLSLQNLEALDSWPEAEFFPEGQQAMDEFREAERKRREYYERRF